MIADRFGALLDELGSLIHKKLTIDSQKTCVLHLQNKTNIYLELDRLGEQINIIIDIGSPPTGPYRENLFREALKANGLPSPKNGVFAYGAKTDSLLLYDQEQIEELNGHRLLETLQTLLQKALVWKQAMERGDIPSYQSTELSFGMKGGPNSRVKGIFGL